MLGLDPRMIKFGVVKMGSTLQEIKDVAGKVQWNRGAGVKGATETV